MTQRHFRLTATDLTHIALGAALITVCSWIAIPFGDIPVTLQTFAIFLITGLLGTKRSLLALLVYVLMGLTGLPVFSGMTAGLGRLVGPTGGYLLGFVFSIPIMGSITHRFGSRTLTLTLSMVLGMITCYSFGTLWFTAVYLDDLGGVGLWTALTKCVIPYLAPDGVKIGVAVMVVRRLRNILNISG